MPARGRLRLYVGTASGVGKTWRLLDDADAAAASGISIVLAEPTAHGRPATAGRIQASGLPRVRLRRAAANPRRLFESGIRVVAVDEVVGTTGGLRPQPRWAAVDELLAAGLDVWATMNAYHAAGEADAARAILGHGVHPGVPDAWIHKAERILVDPGPDVLLSRSRDGLVFPAGRRPLHTRDLYEADRLDRLRALALRVVAATPRAPPAPNR